MNGWPSLFVVTTKDIKKGEEFMGNYGEKFHRCLNDHEKFLERKERRARDVYGELIDR